MPVDLTQDSRQHIGHCANFRMMSSSARMNLSALEEYLVMLALYALKGVLVHIAQRAVIGMAKSAHYAVMQMPLQSFILLFRS